MKLEQLTINNISCYDDVEVGIDEGITTVLGPNGSGKSSLIESIFYALYGSTTKKVTGQDLDDMLKMGTDQGMAKLDFKHQNKFCNATNTIKRQGDSVSSDSKNCILRVGEENWSGVRDMTSQVEELLNMTAEDFARAVYVRQGDVKSLITASSSERQEMFDNLLQLDILNRYHKRAKNGAMRAINREIDIVKDRLKNLRDKLSDTDRGELKQKKSKHRKAIEELEGENEDLEAKKEEITSQINELEEVSEKEASLSDHELKVKKLRKRKSNKADKLSNIDIESLEEKKEEVDPGETREVIDNSISKLESKLNDARNTYQQKKAKVSSLKEKKQEKKALIDKGKCPKCGSNTEKEAFYDFVHEIQEKIEHNEVKQDEYEEKGQKLKKRLEAAKKARDKLNKKEKIEQKIESKKEQKQELLDQINALQEDVEQYKEDIEKIEKWLKDQPDNVDEELDRLEDKKRGVKLEISDNQTEISTYQGDIGKIEEQLDQIDSLQEELKETEERKKELFDVREEIQHIKKTYQEVKQSLRESNLEALNSFTNEYFNLMNTRQAYQGVRITEDYDIKIEARNDTLTPNLLSGGEQALLNLCIRSAVHKILEEGVGSSLPLLLDEPTVFLDTEHITPLQKLLEQLEQEGNQVMMVTHNQELSEIASTTLETVKHDDNNSDVMKVSV